MSNAEVHVEIFDTTLRDGDQSMPQGHNFRPGNKWAVAGVISGIGVDVIEAGFPATNGDAIEVANVAKTIGNIPRVVTEWRDGEAVATIERYPAIAGLTWAKVEDVDITWDALRYAKRPRIHTFISTDEEHMAAKFAGLTQAQVLDMGVAAVQRAIQVSAEHPAATVEASAEAASTTEMGFLKEAIAAFIEHGAHIVNIPDTVGQKDPMSMYKFYRTCIEWIHSINPSVVISAHNHNDIAMATANSFMLIQAATDVAQERRTTINVQVETTVCGVGERAGNADVFPFVMGLQKFSKEGVYGTPVVWRANPGQFYKAARNVMSAAGFAVNRQSPIVGDDINRHRSGIHSSGVLKGGYGLYTPFDPRFVGHPESDIHEEGKYQGRAGRAAAQASA